MPRVFSVDKWIVYFWANENMPLEPVHVHIAYGVPKEMWMTASDDILFDDNEGIRNEWDGEAYEPAQIFPVLKRLIEGE